MRVHSLEVSAFGPFAETVSVDLDDVGRDGLFLLWGPTGAGKTTLLDAVVFALYGTVPGARGEEKRLRSDHSGPDVRTQVRCELTLGEERLRVTRRPEQQRPKKRGTGWTTEQAQLVVQRLTPEGWEPVSTRVDEGSEHLRARLGLSAEQFCQVVLLPQGDFARFLRADPEDRSRLLRTLFDVDRYARAEDWLAEERRLAQQQVEAARAQLSTLLARVAQTADVDIPEDLAPDLLGVAGERADGWVSQVRLAAGVRADLAAGRAEQAAAALTVQDAALAAARTAIDRHDRRDRARADLAAAAAQDEVLQPVRIRWAAGRRAEPLRDVLESAGRAAVAHERAVASLAVAITAWDAVEPGAEADADTARTLRDDVARLRALLPEVARCTGLTREVEQLAGAMAALQEQVDGAERAARDLPERRAAAEKAVSVAERAEAQLAGVSAEVDRWVRSGQAAADAATLAPEVKAAQERVQAFREVWLDARERATDLRTARLDGMAAELAVGLVDDADCPVCGSLEHPRPARSSAPTVAAEDEDAAERGVAAADTALQTGRVALEETRSAIAAAHALAGDLPRAEQEKRLQEARSTLSEVSRVAGGLAGARHSLAELLAAAQDQARLLDHARAELAGHRAELTTTRRTLADVQRQLAEATDEGEDLAGTLARRVDTVQLCEAVVHARTEELRARTSQAEATQRVDVRVREQGFDDVGAAAAALLARGEADSLAARIEAHDHAVAVATAVLAGAELADLGPRPDVPILEAGCQGARTERETAVAEARDAARRVEELDGLAGNLTGSRIELDDRRSWAEQVGSLADLANGRGANTRRMRLQSFVLAARLEQIAEVASRRLRDMSGGRYTFQHSDVAGRNGARGGLGLDVLDEYTGVRRPTKTLSGGESFMASLALALGLADVVTAESGGVRIDTLFVDEGFGSLDPQALDAVMGVLDELRRGGRTVGVISHVEELRTRIPSRIEVVAGREGSWLAS